VTWRRPSLQQALLSAKGRHYDQLDIDHDGKKEKISSTSPTTSGSSDAREALGRRGQRARYTRARKPGARDRLDALDAPWDIP
jgi:hypothetical protein